MTTTWRRHSREFKRQAVEQMKGAENIHALARELGIQRKMLYTWKYQFEGRPEKNHASYATPAVPETIEARLRREIRQLGESLGAKAAELVLLAAAASRPAGPEAE
jgi:transposase-like protein